MGAGQSGDQLAVAVISHVIQSSGPELIAMRKQTSDASKKNNDPKFATRKQFHQAETAVTIDDSDREIFDRLFTLFDKTGAGTVMWREFFVGLAPLTKGSVSERLLLAFELFDTGNTGVLEMVDVKLTFRALNQTAAAMGDPLLSLDRMTELVETVFESAGEDLLEWTGAKPKLRYGGAISEFVDHPIMESYLGQGGGV
mmetsp:Transcript_10445/g.12702  ORF Transcript_10445/g.12702 Transcript_10445/m.12702 type:complete len:199 (+) Transcript_10445:91-687(+)|eukprot:CAMPEP_0114348814 /NCGR_PEP_ID=MMETSP0101-20121206/15022_1 /TAXON_ID=38822 ORGANISM="Pteridomonas danica, Strain PT" /NCGR_SAMPLE_ID=MMETSP0101 /ASSEMBLY_ACC=CAM_ASM_000211 /LENGTH=198 /DNA_ID=CAMNT_0001486991 /DNA_START=107 /DNA_END=703 /DNA_ORIENTATION=-